MCEPEIMEYSINMFLHCIFYQGKQNRVLRSIYIWTEAQATSMNQISKMCGGKTVHVVLKYLSVDILLKDDVYVILLYCFLPDDTQRDQCIFCFLSSLTLLLGSVLDPTYHLSTPNKHPGCGLGLVLCLSIWLERFRGSQNEDKLAVGLSVSYFSMMTSFRINNNIWNSGSF